MKSAVQLQDEEKEVTDPPKYVQVLLAFRAALKRERVKRTTEDKKEEKKELKPTTEGQRKRAKPEKETKKKTVTKTAKKPRKK